MELRDLTEHADFWIVVRRRGGWNAEPQVVGIHNARGSALWACCRPEMWEYDPPIDDTDVLTCHPVMPSIVVTVPADVTPRSEQPARELSSLVGDDL